MCLKEPQDCRLGGLQCKATVGDSSGANTPFGKLQEGNHLLRGVDLSQRVVGVHQYNSSDDQPLKETDSF